MMTFVVATVLTVLWLCMSLTLHTWFYFSAAVDDALLINYTFIDRYTTDNLYALAKVPGYAYWLLLSSKLGLNPDISQLRIWLIAAFVVVIMMYRLSRRSRAVTVFAYLYVLWNPIAFATEAGLRGYVGTRCSPRCCSC